MLKLPLILVVNSKHRLLTSASRKEFSFYITITSDSFLPIFPMYLQHSYSIASNVLELLWLFNICYSQILYCYTIFIILALPGLITASIFFHLLVFQSISITK